MVDVQINISRKKVLAIIIILAFLASNIGVYELTMASTANAPWTLNAPPVSAFTTYVGQYANGTYYWEKGDWQTWANSASFQTVFAAALNSMTKGILHLSTGSFSTTGISFNSSVQGGITIEGESMTHPVDPQGTELVYTPTSGAMFKNNNTAQVFTGFNLKNINLRAETYNVNTACLELGNMGYGSIENVGIINFGVGINLDAMQWHDGTALTQSQQKYHLSNIRIRDCYDGIRFVGNDIGNNYCYDIETVYSGITGHNGLLFDGSPSKPAANNGLNKIYGYKQYGTVQCSINITQNSCLNEIYGTNIETVPPNYAIYITDPNSTAKVYGAGNIIEGQVSKGYLDLGSWSSINLLKWASDMGGDTKQTQITSIPCENDRSWAYEMVAAGTGIAGFNSGAPVHTLSCFLKTPSASYVNNTDYFWETYWYCLELNMTAKLHTSVQIVPEGSATNYAMYGTWSYERDTSNHLLYIRFHCLTNFTGVAYIKAIVNP